MHTKTILEIKKIFILAIPIIFAQVIQISISFINNVMLGYFSNIDVAAIAISTSIWSPIILFFHGIILSLIPIISQLYGSSKYVCIQKYIQQAYLLSILLSIIVILIIYIISIFIPYLPHINTLLASKISLFLKIIVWSTPAYLLLQVLRCLSEGLLYTIPIMIISFISILCYIPLNYIFIYGFHSFPKAGGIGCGLSMVVINWMMCIMVFIWIMYSQYFKNIHITHICIKPDYKIIKNILVLGLPIGFSIFFEVTLFTIVSLFIYPMGIENIISHQIALNFSSFIYIMAFALSKVVTMRIGYFLGSHKKLLAYKISWIVIFIGIIIGFFNSVFTILFRKNIISLYNNNENIIHLASQLIFLAALYQIPDAIQVISSGILKGYKDTLSIFYITFISYWLIGLPIGFILAKTDYICHAIGPAGFWIGFIIALTISSSSMIYRIITIQKN
ncbi:MATE family efflux transporter [Enterobacteriaceae endosymbiont of Macroplea mutica]|uniref:MATE family efflux transporter n=1 Tax=Enterobacteriaceae endosymbiont of Macroplea mutica TaxID=2675791 RepID=UPI0014498F27|nr:MATE family efflux transporter [Enterobacteriaceae endosymbiont of Macroplea mutica]QJC31151.1 MATE family efflux transporter [Enterobacteriaceae endosymbiont of Macroplea mutica]